MARNSRSRGHALLARRWDERAKERERDAGIISKILSRDIKVPAN